MPNHDDAVIDGFPRSMVLLDVETTGGKATRDRIIEISLMVVENGRVVRSWQSLVNPACAVPPWIQKLTGIRTEQLADAPSFAEIAPLLRGVCEGRVLVAHNARFDYAFLKNEFQRLGQPFQMKTLCSVKLSRRFFPQFARHGLDQVIERLGVQVASRHRALDDTRVIWALLKRIHADHAAEDIRAVCQAILQKPAVPAHLAAENLAEIPNRPGIYRFWAADKLLYVGKSVRLRDRVMSHFTQDYTVAKDVQMSAEITHVDFEETPTDFGAQLRENALVKSLRPQHNQRLKKLTRLYQVALQEDENGYLRGVLSVAKQTPQAADAPTFGLFRSRRQAQQWLERACQIHQLCPRLLGLENKQAGPCFAWQLKKCLGACCNQEPAASYNLRVQTAFAAFKQHVWPWPEAVVVIEQSQPNRVLSREEQIASADLCHFHLIDQWRYVQRFTDAYSLYDALEGLSDGALAEDEAACFDLDAYRILIRFLLKTPLPPGLQVVGVSQFRRCAG